MAQAEGRLMEKGCLALVLHSHLPYVRHPQYDDFLEEDWLYEAITETYIPLLQVFEGLVRDRVPFQITLSLSPTLAGMLTDPLLQERYLIHLERLVELAEREVQRTRHEPAFQDIAKMYLERFRGCHALFTERWRGNLVSAFKYFQDLGKLEIITSGATHGYFPLLMVNPKAVRAQILIAVEDYERHFQRRPRGFWLPECGYIQGVDDFLAEGGIRFFFADTHGILHGNPRPRFGVFAPVLCRSRVAALGRDMESSKQVWSSIEGYPGNYDYREFYRDIGFDLDYEYIKPYIHRDGIRVNTGIKYYRITGKGDHKEPYVRPWAMERAAEHAGNFLFNRTKQVEFLSERMGRDPLVVSPYDAELFGHWWFEGPEWLDFLIRKIAYDQKALRLVTPMAYLEEYPRLQAVQPSLSSWGYRGYNEVWLEGSNDWIYRHLHQSAERMVELATAYPKAEGLEKRALTQAARELLLAQSSDWAFIMKTGTAVSYAVKRTKEHLQCFGRLYEAIRSRQIDEVWLKGVEAQDNLFPGLDYRVYGK